jgi:hypothetical protein
VAQLTKARSQPAQGIPGPVGARLATREGRLQSWPARQSRPCPDLYTLRKYGAPQVHRGPSSFRLRAVSLLREALVDSTRPKRRC